MQLNDIAVLINLAVFKDIDNQHKWVRNSLINLMNEEFITEDNYEITEKGEVYLAALKDIPMPVKKWVIDDE